jgi:hypothetical protein
VVVGAALRAGEDPQKSWNLAVRLVGSVVDGRRHPTVTHAEKDDGVKKAVAKHR